MSRIGPVEPARVLCTTSAFPGRVASRQRAVLGSRDTEVGRVDVVHGDHAVAQLVHGGVVGDGELVEPVVAVEDERPLGTELGEHRHEAFRHRRVGDTHDLAFDARGVGERRGEVERGGRAELTARRRRETQAGVVARCEAEADAGFADAALDAGRTEVDDHTERLEDVGRTTLRRRGAPTVLCNTRACGGCDQRGHRGDVHRAGTVATGSTGVDDGSVDATQVDSLGEAQHRANQCGKLGGGLALGTQRHREPGDLRVGGLAGEDRGHGLLDELGRELLAPEQTPDRVGPQRCAHIDVDITGARAAYLAAPTFRARVGR